MVRIVHHEHCGAYRIGSEFSSSRILLVGEDNPQSSDPRKALWPIPRRGSPGCAGKNLQSRIMAIPHITYYGMWRTNLCSPKWEAVAAANRASEIIAPGREWDVIIALGRRVTSAFERAAQGDIPQWGWIRHRVAPLYQLIIASIPHPSGLTRAWNDHGSPKRAQDLLRDIAPEIDWGCLGRIPVLGPQV